MTENLLVQGKSASCHVFRHSAATAMLENGADIRFIQEMLGHAKLTSTQVYTRLSIVRLKAVQTATHPAALLAVRRAGDKDPEEGG